MTLTLTLPTELEANLEKYAHAQHLPVEQFALNLLKASLIHFKISIGQVEEDKNSSPTLEKIAARLKAFPSLTGEQLSSGIEAESNEEDWPTPEKIVARIKALPPAPQNLRLGQGALAEALRSLPRDPDFNLEKWEQRWAEIEEEMETIERLGDTEENIFSYGKLPD